MGRHSRKRVPASGPGRLDVAHVVRDRCWAREVRGAVLCGVLLLGALVLLDWGIDGLTGARVVWWAGLAVLLSVILTPPRVSAQDGELDVRGLVIGHRVCTDRLVAVRLAEGVTQRLVLLDASGGRVELDPRVLAANPLLWHSLEQGARRSLASGTLRCGMPVLEGLGRGIDGAACRGILRASGLD